MPPGTLPTPSVESVELSSESETLEVNGSKSITWTVQPPEAEPKSVKVTSEHTDKVSIEDENQEGKSFSVKGVAPGESTITIDVDGQQDTMTVTVNNPKGTVSAALDGGTLTAGTDAGETKIKVTASGLTFASADKQNFTLAGDGASGLTVSEATGSGESVDLSLTGIPAKAGAITVTVKQAAFAVPPAETTLTAVGVTVAAPTVTLKATPAELTAQEGATSIKLTATGSGFVQEATTYVTVSGIAGVDKSEVTVASDGATDATITLASAPTKAGTLKFEVAAEGFKYQPKAAVSTTVSVKAPTVTISAEPSSIQASSETTEFTITATGSGFASTADSAFTVSGIENVNKSKVTVASDGAKTATLTIDAAPTKEGTLTVEVAPEGFKYQPAAKVSCSIEVTAAAG